MDNLKKGIKANDSNMNMSRIKQLFEASNEGLFDMDRYGRTQFYNTSFYEKFEISLEGSVLDDWRALIHPDDLKQFDEGVSQQIGHNIDAYKNQYKVRTRTGEYVWIESYGIGIFQENGELDYMVGSHRDITDQKIFEDRIYNLAYVDGLTGLFNRSKLNESLVMYLSTKQPGVMIYININDFKVVNDTYGEQTGNRVLIRVGERIKQIFTESSELFRVHADEFAVLIDGSVSKELLNEMVMNLKTSVEGRITLKKNIIDISISLGVCTFPVDVKTPEVMIQRMKLTMRYGKQYNSDDVAYFDERIEKSVLRDLHIETGLRHALENKELYLMYHPIVSVSTKKLASFEALVRWNSPKWGEIYPDQFIPIAERTRDILSVGQFVLTEACKFIRQVRQQTGMDVKVSVNVSVVQLVQSDFVEQIIETVKETGINPEALTIEITESLTLDANDFILESLKNIRAQGISISLDDFGTGYSSVSNLMTLPMHSLKVDRMVMLKAMNHESISKFIRSVVKLCHDLGIDVVAEGIEDESMVEKARLMGVDYLQGYLYAPPLNEDDVFKYIDEE